MTTEGKGMSDRKLRSRAWFDNPDNADMTALYLERYLNFGLRREELQSGKPIIGIAQTGSDLSPCNRHHIELAKRVRDGIRDAGGIALEFPVHPIQETGKRPTAGLDRNLAYLSLVEVLYGYPLDGVVLTIGCDKTTPAMLMGAATVNIPAIALSRRADAQWLVPRRAHRLGHHRVEGPPALWRPARSTTTQIIDIVASSAPSTGYCNTMGTASTMNSLAEALGMQLPGSARDPGALSRPRRRWPIAPGMRIVDMVHEDLKPSDILTKDNFHQRHRRQFGDRRLDQCADPHQRHRPPHRRRARAQGMGDRTATRCRCWSICSRPASIWARTITTPAACRRWSTS